MSIKDNIWFFFITVFSILIGIFQFALAKENGDSNAASMYLVVFGILSFICWGVSFFFMSVCKSFFRNRKMDFLSFVIPSLLFLASLLFVDRIYFGMVVLVTCISSMINLFFYLKTSSATIAK